MEFGTNPNDRCGDCALRKSEMQVDSTEEGDNSMLEWSTSLSEIPGGARSGHSFSIGSSQGFLFGGCLDKGPTAELWQLNLSSLSWDLLDNKLEKKGRSPLPRWKHSMCMHENRLLVVFGGFHSFSTRLGDTWTFDTIGLGWEEIKSGGSSIENPCKPSPRAGHSATKVGNKMWVIGGYGGESFARKDWNDVHVFDLETLQWERPPLLKGFAPEPRTGHSAVGADDKIVIFGGWNATEQFSDMFILETSLMSWTRVQTSLSSRWDHVSCHIKAIPNSKVFVFGGFNKTESTESKFDVEKSRGTLSDELLLFDVGNHSISKIKARNLPAPRSDSSLTFDKKRSRLLLIGGWSQMFLGDVVALDVSSFVGPLYSVTRLSPNQGPVCGGTTVNIHGNDFTNIGKDQKIKVRFSSATADAIEVNGVFINKELIQCKTPSFSAEISAKKFGALKAEVRVAISDDSFTTTFQVFEFVTVASPEMCIAFGPGLLDGLCPGHATSFIIVAKDLHGKTRLSGGDEFEVLIKKQDLSIEKEEIIPVKVFDHGDGTFSVDYLAPSAGYYIIEVLYTGSFVDDSGYRYETGRRGRIRGSPFRATFISDAPRSSNLINGSVFRKKLQSNIQAVKQRVEEIAHHLEIATNPKLRTNLALDADLLVAVKESLLFLEEDANSLSVDIDSIKYALEAGRGLKLAKTAKMAEDTALKWEKLQCEADPTLLKTNLRPYILKHGTATKDAIFKFHIDLRKYEGDLFQESFFEWVLDAHVNLEAISTAYEDLATKKSRTEELARLAVLFECEELMAPIEEITSKVSVLLGEMEAFWDCANNLFIFLEVLKGSFWNEFDASAFANAIAHHSRDFEGLPEMPRCADAGKEMQNYLTNLESLGPLLKNLHSSSLRDRHWKLLRKITHKPHFPNPSKDSEWRITVGDFIDLELLPFSKDMEAVCLSARNEAKMEDELIRIQESWIGQDLQFDDNANLISSSDVMDKLESDCTVLLSMAKGDSYENFLLPFESLQKVQNKGLKFWSHELPKLRDLINQILQAQIGFCQLEPLFSSRDLEFRKEVRAAEEKFSHAGSRFEILKKECSKVKKALKISRRSNVVQDLADIVSELQSCQAHLKDYVEMKREDFGRFYQLDEVSLFLLLSQCNAIGDAWNNCIPLIFPGIESFFVDEENKFTCWRSVDAEVGKFEVRVTLGNPDVFAQLADGIHESIKSQIIASSNRYERQSRRTWITHGCETGRPDLMQVIEFAVMNVFRKDVEGLFNVPISSLKEYLIKKGAQMEEIAGALRETTFREGLKRLEYLLLLDCSGRDLVQSLIKRTHTDDSAIETSFLWSSQMKRAIKSDDSLCVECANVTFPYMGDFISSRNLRVIITETTVACFRFLSEGLHLQEPTLLHGKAGAGKTIILQEFADSMGVTLQHHCCTASDSSFKLANLVQASAKSKFWLVLDKIDQMPNLELKNLTLQRKVSKDKSVIFATLSSNAALEQVLHDGMFLFRPMELFLPNFGVISEHLFMSKGLRADSNQVAEIFSEKNLRNLKALLKTCTTDDDFQLSIARYKQNGGLDDRPEARLWETLVEACGERDLWPDHIFISTMVSLHEMMKFGLPLILYGTAGGGKTESWKTLHRARQILQEDLIYDVIFHEVEKKPDLQSVVAAALERMPEDSGKWLILDGEVSGTTLEPLQTRLESHECQILIETCELAHASPHVLSRTTLVFIDSVEKLWRSLLASWVQRLRFEEDVREIFFEILQEIFFEEIEATMERFMGENAWHHSVSVFLNMIEALLADLDFRTDLKTKQEVKLSFERIAMFCFVWAFGSRMSLEERQTFSQWLRENSKINPFPTQRASIFEYALSPGGEFLPWKSVAANEGLHGFAQVPELRAIAFWGKSLLENSCMSICVSGDIGVGKTATLNELIITASPFDIETHTIRPWTRSARAPKERTTILFLEDLHLSTEFSFYEQVRFLREHQKRKMIAESSNNRAISKRTLRHFAVLKMGWPEKSSFRSIARTMLTRSFGAHQENFSAEAINDAVEATADACKGILKHFPAAIHLHKLERVFQGIAISCHGALSGRILKVWLHEMRRELVDSFENAGDAKLCDELVCGALQNRAEIVESRDFPLLWIKSTGGSVDEIGDVEAAVRSAELCLEKYNSTFQSTPIDLVVTELSLLHLLRLCRLLALGGRPALVVGPRFTGRRSLLRLAAFVLGFESTYDLHEAIVRSGKDEIETCAIIEGSSLTSSDLEELLAIWAENSHNQKLHVCFLSEFVNEVNWHPKILARGGLYKFPPWSSDSRISIAKKILLGTNEELCRNACNYYEKAFQASLIVQMPQFISFLRRIMPLQDEMKQEISLNASNTDRVLQRLHEIEESMRPMEDQLSELQVLEDTATAKADSLVEDAAREREVFEKQQTILQDATRRKEEGNVDVDELEARINSYFEKAEPNLVAVEEALEDITKKDVGECKSIESPPPTGVADVFAAATILLCGVDRTIQFSLKNGKPLVSSWEGYKKVTLGNINAFISNMKEFKDKVKTFQVPSKNWDNVRPLLELEHVNVDRMEKVNKACAVVTMWVRAIVRFHDEIVPVEPLLKDQAAAKVRVHRYTVAFQKIDEVVAEIARRLERKQQAADEAVKRKNEASVAANEARTRVNLSRRISAALSSEVAMFEDSLVKLEQSFQHCENNALQAAALIHLLGPLDAIQRNRCIDVDCFDSCHACKWVLNGLPDDRHAKENAIIVENSGRERPLLCVDPQMHCLSWLRNCKFDEVSCTKNLSWKETLIKWIKKRQPRPLLLLLELSSNLEILQKVIQASWKHVNFQDSTNLRLVVHTSSISMQELGSEIAGDFDVLNFELHPGRAKWLLGAAVRREEAKDLECTIWAAKSAELRANQRLNEIEAKLVGLVAAEDIQLSETKVDEVEQLTAEKNELEMMREEAQEILLGSQSFKESVHEVAGQGETLFFALLEVSFVSWNLFQAHFLQSLSRDGEFLFSFGHDPTQSLIFEMMKQKVETPVKNPFREISIRRKSAMLKASAQAIIEELLLPSLAKEDVAVSVLRIHARVLLNQGEMSTAEFDALFEEEEDILDPGPMGPLEWLGEDSWRRIRSLESCDCFNNLGDEMIQDADEWKCFVFDEGKNLRMPFTGMDLTDLQKLILLRRVKPTAFQDEVTNVLSKKFALNRAEFVLPGRHLPPILLFDDTKFDIVQNLQGLAKQAMVQIDVIIWTGKPGNMAQIGSRMQTISSKGGWLLIHNIALNCGPFLERLVADIVVAPEAQEKFRLMISFAGDLRGLKSQLNTILQPMVPISM